MDPADSNAGFPVDAGLDLDGTDFFAPDALQVCFGHMHAVLSHVPRAVGLMDLLILLRCTLDSRICFRGFC